MNRSFNPAWGLTVVFLTACTVLQAQHVVANAITKAERDHVERIGFEPIASRGIETPPHLIRCARRNGKRSRP